MNAPVECEQLAVCEVAREYIVNPCGIDGEADVQPAQLQLRDEECANSREYQQQ